MAGLALGSKNELEDMENGADGDEAGETDGDGDRLMNCDDQVCI